MVESIDVLMSVTGGTINEVGKARSRGKRMNKIGKRRE